MKVEAQNKAIQLRESGMSINTIAKEINVSKSSVSKWCRNVELTNEQKIAIDTAGKEVAKAALAPFIDKQKFQKAEDMLLQNENGIVDVGYISKRDLFIIGLGLYWGEGYKRGSQELGFTNSDPRLLRTFIIWLEDMFDIQRDTLIARVTINSNYLDETGRIQNEWCEVLGLKRSQFTKTSFITSESSVYRNPETYRGTLRLKARNGTSLRRRILSSIQYFSDQISLGRF